MDEERDKQHWLVTMKKWSQVQMLLLPKWISQEICGHYSRVLHFVSVHLHLFGLLVFLCFSISFFTLVGYVSSAVLLIHLRGLLHTGLWSVDHWITHVL